MSAVRQTRSGMGPAGAPRPGAVLVTGTSSGLGVEIAVHLAASGFPVVATMRDLSRRGALEDAAARRGVSLRIRALDVLDRRSAADAVAAAVEEFGALYAVVNNAGVQVRGYFEDVDERDVRDVFETNVFGAMTVTRAALPHLRVAGRGRIVLVSSVAARLPAPALTAYCASKWALEGFGEALGLELGPFGIDVSIIEPGIIRTPIWQANRNVARGSANAASPYHRWFIEAERLANAAVESAPTTPGDVARAVERALRARRPRRRYLVGRRAAVLLAIRRLLPAEWFDRIYGAAITRRITPRT